MKEVEGAPNSETAITAIEVRGPCARYGLAPVTGKKHQLRVHMAALGIPIRNDRLYPDAVPRSEVNTSHYAEPLQLLAKSLSFTDPVLGVERQFESRFSLLW
jgi:tRNA pseudouridine32 synthase/23S rRNA pseudouridine746 synthase